MNRLFTMMVVVAVLVGLMVGYTAHHWSPFDTDTIARHVGQGE